MTYCTVVRSASLNILLYILLSFVLLYIHLNPHMKCLLPTGNKTKIKRLSNILTANGQYTHFICQKLYLKKGKKEVLIVYLKGQNIPTRLFILNLFVCALIFFLKPDVEKQAASTCRFLWSVVIIFALSF